MGHEMMTRRQGYRDNKWIVTMGFLKASSDPWNIRFKKEAWEDANTMQKDWSP